MKKAFKTLAMTLVMALTVTTMAFADSAAATKLQEKLRALGVADTYIGTAVEHLQKVELTDAQVNAVIAKAEEVKALIGSETDLSKLDATVKNQVKTLVQDAAKTLNLTVSFNKGSVSVVNTNGKAVLSLTSVQAKELLKNLDVTKVTEAIKAAAEFSQSADKNKFTPVSGTLNKTATNAGNVMAAGLGLVALAGALFVGSKKVLA